MIYIKKRFYFLSFICLQIVIGFHHIFQDQLMEYYELNGKFPGIVAEYPRRIAPLINWMSWFIVIMLSLCYSLWYVFTSGNWYLIISTTSLFVLGIISVYVMIGSTKIKKGSVYGDSQTKQQSSPNNNINSESTQTSLRKRFSTINNSKIDKTQHIDNQSDN